MCYETTDASTYTEAVKLYKELIKNVVDEKKVSRFAKVPVAFVGTKLDLTDFLKSDMTAVPRCIKVADLRAWLTKVHKRADNACFEISARENIGIAMMIDWVVKAALRAHPLVEKAKKKQADRFSSNGNANNLNKFLAGTGEIPDLDEQFKDID